MNFIDFLDNLGSIPDPYVTVCQVSTLYDKGKGFKIVHYADNNDAADSQYRNNLGVRIFNAMAT